MDKALKGTVHQIQYVYFPAKQK